MPCHTMPIVKSTCKNTKPTKITTFLTTNPPSTKRSLPHICPAPASPAWQPLAGRGTKNGLQPCQSAHGGPPACCGRMYVRHVPVCTSIRAWPQALGPKGPTRRERAHGKGNQEEREQGGEAEASRNEEGFGGRIGGFSRVVLFCRIPSSLRTCFPVSIC